MTCDEFQTQLTSYLDGTLNADECAALASHAATCAACELRLELATAGALPVFAPPLPTELRAPVLQAVVDRKRQSRSTFLARASAVVGIAALIAFMLRPTFKPAQLVVADSSSVTAANLAPGGERSPADERAQSEFMALDDAAVTDDESASTSCACFNVGRSMNAISAAMPTTAVARARNVDRDWRLRSTTACRTGARNSVGSGGANTGNAPAVARSSRSSHAAQVAACDSSAPHASALSAPSRYDVSCVWNSSQVMV